MWLILSLAAVCLFTAQNLLMRVLAVKSDHPRTFSFVFNCWGTLFAAIVYLIDQPGRQAVFGPVSAHQWMLITGAILAYGLYERSHFLARKQLDASTTAILFRLNPVITFVGALLFLREPFSWDKGIGGALLIGASFVLVHKNPSLRASKAVWIALFSAIALGLAGVLDKPASAELPASLYSVMVWGGSLPVVAFPAISLRQIKKEFTIGGWKTAVTALLNVCGFILYINALGLADASRVNPVVSSSGTLVVIAGIVFLKEYSHIGKKIFAGILMLLGVLLLR
jgi:drug/metabolite transporter (DMT)-like permease